MLKKCKKCGVPLEGILYKFIACKLFGVRPSENDGSFCNKCCADPAKDSKQP